MSENLADDVRMLRYWRDGNGAKGAEERLQDCERRIDAVEDNYVTRDTLEAVVTRAVQSAMAGGKSARQWLQVLAPYAAVAVSLYLAMRGPA